MRTDFSPAQLEEPALQQANTILRSCVRCGICTAHCPTYQLLGNEADSPRGRIYLIRQMLQQKSKPSPEMVLHIDRCLSCLACSSICPSDVDYRHLLDQARNHIEKHYDRPIIDRMLRLLLAQILVRPKLFRFLMRFSKPLAVLKKRLPDARIQAMLGMIPAQLPTETMPKAGWHHPEIPATARVGLFLGCVQTVLAPRLYQRSVALLNRFGISVFIPEQSHCCGAIVQHMGKEEQAQNLAQQAMKAFPDDQKLDAIIVNVSGCGSALKDYPHFVADSEEFAAKCKDITEYLADCIPPEPTKNFTGQGKVIAYHAACSLQHGQQIVDAPKKLLTSAGFIVKTPRDSHICCGSAGTYNLLQPEISKRLQENKVEYLQQLEPDFIAAGNIGCLMQIGQKSTLPIVHTLELLDWAYGGAEPKTLA